MEKKDFKKNGEPKLNEVGFPRIIVGGPETDMERAERMIREREEWVKAGRCGNCGHGKFIEDPDGTFHCDWCGLSGFIRRESR